MKHSNETVISQSFVEEFAGNSRRYSVAKILKEDECENGSNRSDENIESAPNSKANSEKKSNRDHYLNSENRDSPSRRSKNPKRKATGKDVVKQPCKQRKLFANIQEAIDLKEGCPAENEERTERESTDRDLEILLNSPCDKELIVDQEVKKRTKSHLSNTKRVLSDSKKASKNVHTQRRILANARERSRVHKLGEAFNLLRRVIPSYSADQKLSKLSILKIAISYISALGNLLNYDKSTQAKQLFESSVSECTFALQSEFGRAKGSKGARRVKAQTKDESRQTSN